MKRSKLWFSVLISDSVQLYYMQFENSDSESVTLHTTFHSNKKIVQNPLVNIILSARKKDKIRINQRHSCNIFSRPTQGRFTLYDENLIRGYLFTADKIPKFRCHGYFRQGSQTWVDKKKISTVFINKWRKCRLLGRAGWGISSEYDRDNWTPLWTKTNHQREGKRECLYLHRAAIIQTSNCL